MSRTFHHGKNKDRQIRVRGVRRDPVDLRRLARALIALAQAEAERAAQAAHDAEAGMPATPPTDEPVSKPERRPRRSGGREA